MVSYALGSCHNVEPHRAPPTQEQLLQQKYDAWAARQPRPTWQLVNQVEAALSREPCIGNLDRWSRSYAFNMLPETTVDTAIVDFHLEGAGGPLGIKPGKRVTAPDAWVRVDDRPIRIVDGDYDLREHRIHVAFCGNNIGEPAKGGINNMHTYFDELKRRRSAHGT